MKKLFIILLMSLAASCVYAQTATPTKSPIPTYTFTPTPSITITATFTVTVTFTVTPEMIWHHSTKDSDHGTATITASNGQIIIDLSDADPYFIDGSWTSKVTRDHVSNNTYLYVVQTGGVLTVEVVNRADNSPYDCSSDPVVIFWNVWRSP